MYEQWKTIILTKFSTNIGRASFLHILLSHKERKNLYWKQSGTEGFTGRQKYNSHSAINNCVKER